MPGPTHGGMGENRQQFVADYCKFLAGSPGQPAAPRRGAPADRVVSPVAIGAVLPTRPAKGGDALVPIKVRNWQLRLMDARPHPLRPPAG